MKILAIDNDPAVVAYLKKYLSFKGHNFSSAPNAKTGIELNKALQPQLILVEVDLGPKAETNLLTALTRDNPGASIVILASDPTVESAIDAMKNGASDYLRKPYLNAPVDLEKLKKLISAHLGKVETLEV